MSAVLSPDQFVNELWSYARQVPMIRHPWFDGIIQHRWTREEIIVGEIQHYLRVRTNPIFFGYIAVNAVQEQSYGLMATVLDNFMEELGGERTHVDIVLQFLEEGGISREQADQADPAPGTMAAIEMIVGGCQRRSALEGLAILTFAESQHGGSDGVAARCYRELVEHYGFSKRAAETYYIHAEQDVGHGSRQVNALKEFATDAEKQEKIRRAAQLGITAFNLEWDGHVQAITGKREFWPGVEPLRLRRPAVRLPAQSR
jgi:pyrroloquinoline quinone (PQQ) biosynthesis protein C